MGKSALPFVGMTGAWRETLVVAIEGVVNCTGKALPSLGLLIISGLISVDHVQGKSLHSLE